MSQVPPGRYVVIYSTDPTGARTEFSAPDDKAAWAYAERGAWGARIVQLARIQIQAGGDEIQVLTKPSHDQAKTP